MVHLVFIQQNPLPFATLLNGACHRVAPDATAFGHRDASFAREGRQELNLTAIDICRA
jgi:hypothetical protein